MTISELVQPKLNIEPLVGDSTPTEAENVDPLPLIEVGVLRLDKAQVQKNFGLHALTYDHYAVVQKEMARELLDKIRRTGRGFKNILEIGCGTGFLTESLAREYPKARIIATDIAPEMIDVAKEKLTYFSNIEYYVADGENLSTINGVPYGNQPFDLIVSNVVFQWFTDYAGTFAKFHSYLEPGGYLIFSTLGAGTFEELYVCLKGQQGKHLNQPGSKPLGGPCKHETHQKREPFVENKYLQMVMHNTGFKYIGLEKVTKKEYFESCRYFLRALKMIGAHNYLVQELAAHGLGSGIFTLIKNYDAMFWGGRGVPATYQCLYGWGQRTT